MTQHSLRPLRDGETISNPDGSFSTERTLNVLLPDGSNIVIPSLFMGANGPVQFQSEEDALRAALAFERRTGRKFPRFGSMKKGVAFAVGRSKTGGIANGPLAGFAPFNSGFPPQKSFADGLKR